MNIEFVNTLSSRVCMQYASKKWVTNNNYSSSSTMASLIKFSTSMPLSTTYAGCKISLWYNGTNWYGFGVKNYQLIYNVPVRSSHIFQVNNTG